MTATDAAGQPSSYEYTFFGIPELELACTYDDDSNMLLCQGNNDVVSSTCAFDGQAAVQCSLPVEIRLTGLRLGHHNVTVTATDLFGQTESVFSIFEFALGPINISVPSAASVIEGKELSPVMFSISGQALSTFPFSLSPLTYSQFETQTGLSVNGLFDNVPPPATISKQLAEYFGLKIITSLLFRTGDFDESTINFDFEVTPAEVSQSYTYNAVLEDDEENENIEGFILYFRFTESQFNPDDYNRLSQTSGVTLVTLIDNDGRMFFFLAYDF